MDWTLWVVHLGEKIYTERANRAVKQMSRAKKRKGPESEPLPSKTPFHPVPNEPGHHHPGKIKNHLACNGASALPPLEILMLSLNQLIHKA